MNDFRKQNRDHFVIINLMAAFSLVFSWFSVSLVGVGPRYLLDIY